MRSCATGWNSTAASGAGDRPLLRGAPVGLADDALGLLVELPWPLNDLELETLLYRALVVSRASVVRAADLLAAGLQLSGDTPPPPSQPRRRRS